jgi:hypothetical protein
MEKENKTKWSCLDSLNGCKVSKVTLHNVLSPEVQLSLSLSR